MGIHRGKLLQKVLKDEGRSATWLARKRGLNRTTIYTWFRHENLNLDLLLSIGKDLRYDFSRQIPELANIGMANEPEESYKADARISLSECIRQRDEYRNKYFKLLERFAQSDQ